MTQIINVSVIFMPWLIDGFWDYIRVLRIRKVHINIIITSFATHCADVSLPGRCLPKMAPTPLKIRPWAGSYFLFLFVLATQTCNSALGAFTGIAGKYSKSYQPVFEKIAPNFWHFRPLKAFNQIHIFTMHWYLLKEATCQTWQKVIIQFLRNQAFKLKVDGQRDRQTDDGQLGFRKAPLPFGWRS